MLMGIRFLFGVIKNVLKLSVVILHNSNILHYKWMNWIVCDEREENEIVILKASKNALLQNR